jgi:hypothetical protein
MNHVLEDIDVDEDRSGRDTLRFREEEERLQGMGRGDGFSVLQVRKCTVLVDICAECFLRKK